MARNKDVKDVSEVSKLLDTTGIVVDGNEILKDLGFGSNKPPHGTIQEVIDLKKMRSEECPTPGIRGIFRGYSGVWVRQPGRSDGKKNLMNWVLLTPLRDGKPVPGLLYKHLGSYDIMQGMQTVRVGQEFALVLPDLPPVQLPDDKTLTRYIVVPYGVADNTQYGFAKPFGDWAATSRAPDMVVDGEPIDQETGEVKASTPGDTKASTSGAPSGGTDDVKY